jgi:tetratricopeptide (TPR) repeat protein
MHASEDERWEGLRAQAEAWFRARNSDRLEAVASEMIAHDAEHPLGYRFTGDAWLQRGNLKKADEWIGKALALDPEDDFLHYRLAIVRRARSRYAKADEHIREAIRLDPEYADYWAELAELCFATDDERGMDEALTTALELEPDNAEALHLRARATAMGSPSQALHAIPQYQRALEVDPEDAYVHHNLGRALLANRRFDAAEQHLLAAVRLDPNDRDFRRGYYEVLKKRSTFYRWLRRPGEWLAEMWKGFARIPTWGWIALVLTRVWKYLVGFALAASVFWALFLWPPLMAYNYLVISDIKAKASEIGAPRGFHALPRWVRMAIFGVFSIGLWSGLYLVLTGDQGATVTAWIIGIVVLGYLVICLYGLWLTFRDWRINRRRRKAMAEL